QILRLTTQQAPQPELGLEEILPAATVPAILTAEGALWKEVLYTPWVTFWTFFWQMLSPDRSCRAALKRLAAWMGLHGQKLNDEDPGPYCKARALARIGTAPADAPAGLPNPPPGTPAVAVVRPCGQGGRWQHGDHARHPGQPEGLSPEPVPEARVRLPD